MSPAHPEIGPELRKLAQAVLDAIDPVVKTAAALTAGAGLGTGKCQQVWCPVCAMAALATGEQHPLLTIIADHSIALLDAIRGIVDDIDRSPELPPDGSPDGGITAGPDVETIATNGAAKTRYEPISLTVEE